MVPGLAGKTYEERSAELGLETPEERRHQADMAMVHNVMHCKGGQQDTVQRALPMQEMRARPSRTGCSLRGPSTRPSGTSGSLQRNGTSGTLQRNKYLSKQIFFALEDT